MGARAARGGLVFLENVGDGKSLQVIPVRVVSSNRHADVLLCASAHRGHPGGGMLDAAAFDGRFCLKVLHVDEACVRYQFNLLSRLARIAQEPVSRLDRPLAVEPCAMPSVLGYGRLLARGEAEAVESYRGFSSDTASPSSFLRNGSAYVLTPWLEGSTLLGLIAGAASGAFELSAARALSLLASLANALARLIPEEAGARLVHRDVKPSNIMVSPGPTSQVTLVDYDTAAFVGDSANAAPNGTFGYAAPETFVWNEGLGRSRRAVDSAADVFSFGVVAHEVLTGRWPYPFAPRYLTERSWQGFFGRCERICVDENLPSAWRDLLDACLSLDPMRRPDVRELPDRLACLQARCGSQRLAYRIMRGHDPLPTCFKSMQSGRSDGN